jgi:hypothetical protein
MVICSVDCTTVTLCRFLVSRQQIAQDFFDVCNQQPACGFDHWTEHVLPRNKHIHLRSSGSGSSESNTGFSDVDVNHSASQQRTRVVLSYSHNGFGNQLWEHSVALMIAQQLNASLFIGLIPEKYRLQGELPVNTMEGYCPTIGRNVVSVVNECLCDGRLLGDNSADP